MSANLNTFNGILWIAANPILFSRLASCRFGLYAKCVVKASLITADRYTDTHTIYEFCVRA